MPPNQFPMAQKAGETILQTNEKVNIIMSLLQEFSDWIDVIEQT